MPIVVVCPGCRKRYEVDASLAGKKSRSSFVARYFPFRAGRESDRDGYTAEAATHPQRPARELFSTTRHRWQAIHVPPRKAFKRDPWHKRRQAHQRELPGCGKRDEIDTRWLERSRVVSSAGRYSRFRCRWDRDRTTNESRALPLRQRRINSQQRTYFFTMMSPLLSKELNPPRPPLMRRTSYHPRVECLIPNPFGNRPRAEVGPSNRHHRSPAGSWHSMPWRFSVSGFFARSPARCPARPRWSSRATCSPCHSLA